MDVIRSLIRTYFPGLASDPSQLDSICAKCSIARIPAEHILFQPGQVCSGFFLVTSGTVKVILTAANGREAMLYRIGAGETCLVTTSCLFSASPYPASGMAETDCTALVLQPDAFKFLMSSNAGFQALIFANLSRRFGELIQRIESLNFDPIEARLAAALLSHSNASNLVKLTHQELAIEVGTAREVVSRHLRQLEKQEVLENHRGLVKILNRRRLVEQSNTPEPRAPKHPLDNSSPG